MSSSAPFRGVKQKPPKRRPQHARTERHYRTDYHRYRDCHHPEVVGSHLVIPCHVRAPGFGWGRFHAS